MKKCLPFILHIKAAAICVVLCLLLSAARLSAREITDMNKRRVRVPDKITRVFAVSPSIEYMVYAIDSSLLAARTGNAGMKGTAASVQARFFNQRYLQLPAIGGAFGNGLTMSPEMLLKIKPDVVLVRGDEGAYSRKDLEQIEKYGIPVVNVDVSSLTRYADSFDFLGNLLGREKRAAALSSYSRKALAEVDHAVTRIPADKRVTVYNSRMTGGLDTACDGSSHAEVIRLAGGRNPVACATKEFTGIQKINLEQLITLNPEAMVIYDPGLARDVFEDPQLREIRAVRNRRVYLTPALPLNWFDGPPSMMGILGVQWLAGDLYPNLYKKDIRSEAQRFIELYFGVKVSKSEIDEIMAHTYH